MSTFNQNHELSRNLRNRHLQLIAIGGAIGTGLFMGSGKTISLAGPSVLLVYGLIGFFLFFMMRALGEILLSNLNYRTFADFAGDLIGPWAQFFMGWTYWLCWIVVGIADIIAIANYTAFWFPELAPWVPSLSTIIVLVTFNTPSVKYFGEIEFYFSMIKIIAICSLILLGTYLLITKYVAPDGTMASVTNLWNYGGFFPNGFAGFLAGFQIAIFAFQGLELVGTAAAETENPEVNLPKAINSIPIRVALFYLGALFVIMTVMPWTKASPSISPFVAMFSLSGLLMAAHIVNFVVITSAASSANSGIYSSSRMMFNLADREQAPAILSKLNKHQVPLNALFFSCIFLFSSVALLYAGQGIIAAFTFMTTISATLFIWVWSMIVISYLRYLKKFPEKHQNSKFKMPGGKFSAYMVLVFFGCVIWALALEHDTLQALMLVPVWFIILGISYLVLSRNQSRKESS